MQDIEDSNFIFILYDMHREETKFSIRDTWLPKILQVRGKNIVRVCNLDASNLQPMIGVIAMKADKDEDELPQEELKPIADWHPVRRPF